MVVFNKVTDGVGVNSNCGFRDEILILIMQRRQVQRSKDEDCVVDNRVALTSTPIYLICSTALT
jgi:hypothetical protein